jgi:hypothetical protein
MKNYLLFAILLVISCSPASQNESDEPNIPTTIEIYGSSSISFNTFIGQTIKFPLDNETLYATVLEIDNHLCPSDPGIQCITEGFLIATFQLTHELESDTLMLRYGFHPKPDSWKVYSDSVTTSLSSKSYRFFLTHAVYYNGILSDKISKLTFTMRLKKI